MNELIETPDDFLAKRRREIAAAERFARWRFNTLLIGVVVFVIGFVLAVLR